MTKTGGNSCGRGGRRGRIELNRARKNKTSLTRLERKGSHCMRAQQGRGRCQTTATAAGKKAKHAAMLKLHDAYGCN